MLCAWRRRGRPRRPNSGVSPFPPPPPPSPLVCTRGGAMPTTPPMMPMMPMMPTATCARRSSRSTYLFGARSSSRSWYIPLRTVIDHCIPLYIVAYLPLWCALVVAQLVHTVTYRYLPASLARARRRAAGTRLLLSRSFSLALSRSLLLLSLVLSRSLSFSLVSRRRARPSFLSPTPCHHDAHRR